MIGPFEVVTSSALVKPRLGFTACIIDRYLYVLGGSLDANPETGSIERALINTDGSLGQFFAFADSTVAARSDHVTIIIGNDLYLIGGTDGVNGGFANNVAQAQLRLSCKHMVNACAMIELLAIGSTTSVEVGQTWLI